VISDYQTCLINVSYHSQSNFFISVSHQHNFEEKSGPSTSKPLKNRIFVYRN
jgi:hypothetical protein